MSVPCIVARAFLPALGPAGACPAFFAGGFGAGELVVLVLLAVVLFGPKRLPEIARSIGRAMEKLRRASHEFQDQIENIDEEPPRPPPAQNSEGGRPRDDSAG